MFRYSSGRSQNATSMRTTSTRKPSPFPTPLWTNSHASPPAYRWITTTLRTRFIAYVVGTRIARTSAFRLGGSVVPGTSAAVIAIPCRAVHARMMFTRSAPPFVIGAKISASFTRQGPVFPPKFRAPTPHPGLGSEEDTAEPRSPLFPYTTLFRSHEVRASIRDRREDLRVVHPPGPRVPAEVQGAHRVSGIDAVQQEGGVVRNELDEPAGERGDSVDDEVDSRGPERADRQEAERRVLLVPPVRSE